MSTATPLLSRARFFRKLPIVTLAELAPDNKQCAICKLRLTKASKPVLLHDAHVFCKECILSWFKQSSGCPLCRRQMWTSIENLVPSVHPMISPYINIHPQRVAEDVLIFDDDVMNVRDWLSRQQTRVLISLRGRADSLMSDEDFEDFEYERRMIDNSLKTLMQWREDMYRQAPDRVIWAAMRPAPENLPSAIGARHNCVWAWSRHGVRALNQAVRGAGETIDTVTGEAGRSVLTHPLTTSVLQELECALCEIDDFGIASCGVGRFLQQGVDELAPSLVARAAKGMEDALVMQQFVKTLINSIMEAHSEYTKPKSCKPAGITEKKPPKVPYQLRVRAKK